MTALQETLSTIRQHPAVNNAFYDAWLGGQLTPRQLEVFAENYSAWVRSFPDCLATLVGTTKEIDAKVEFAKTLHSELGYGDPTKAHSVLLDSFFLALGRRMGNEGAILAALQAPAPLDSTKALIHGEAALYCDQNRRKAAGAQLALEWQAYTMLRKLYEGARNYASLWNDEDEFHEDCEYFYAHIGAAEKDHKVESLKGVEQFMPNGEGLSEVLEGYNAHLELIAGLWNGIAAKAEMTAK